MKSEFSTSWVSSRQKRKQRKYGINAPLHTRHRFLSANLSKELRKKYAKRNLPLKKGDEVLIMRGSFRKKKAKVNSINLKRVKVYLEGIQRQKKDGTKVNVPFHPSALQIQTLILEDKERSSALSRKSTPKTQHTNKEPTKEKAKGEKNASN